MQFTKRKDKYIIISIFLLCLIGALLFYFNRNEGKVKAQIQHFGEIIATIDLSSAKDEIIEHENLSHVTIRTTENGEIYFESSDCPDQVCVHAGKLHSTGEMAACLPNGIVISLIGEEEIDALI